MLRIVRFVRQFCRSAVVAAAIVMAVAAVEAQQVAATREPASKAAAILTWPSAKREQYIAALDAFFLTRTVKAGPHPHGLDRGRPLAAFEAGGARADAFNAFLTSERVRGVLVLRTARSGSNVMSPHTAERRGGTRFPWRNRSRQRSSAPR